LLIHVGAVKQNKICIVNQQSIQSFYDISNGVKNN